MCTNTQGSFECSCNSGYTLSVDGTTCIGKRSNELFCVFIERSDAAKQNALALL